MSQPIISVENLSKGYRIGAKEDSADTLVGALTNSLRAPLRNLRRLREATTIRDGEDGDDVLWALKDVSFDVQEGEVVGIIGRNGAGKSTLLKILSRITEPTSGRAVIRGRVSSLLEVGTGFHPELTGRENVYMNGTILGMTKREIDRKFDEIVDFSGVEKFLDTPTKHYSSGMQVRLAFAVAAHLEPEILIIDEVLAVGDAVFQKSCISRMQQLAASGVTLLIVSHSLDMVRRLASNGILLHHGRVACTGDTNQALDSYAQSSTELSQPSIRSQRSGPAERALIVGIDMLTKDGVSTRLHTFGHDMTFVIAVQSSEAARAISLSIALCTRDGEKLLVAWSDEEGCEIHLSAGMNFIVCKLPDMHLRPERHITVDVWLEAGDVRRISRRCLDFDTVSASSSQVSGNIHQGFFYSSSTWKCSPGDKQMLQLQEVSCSPG